LAATDRLCVASIVALGANAEFTLHNENVGQDELAKKNLPIFRDDTALCWNHWSSLFVSLC
jgi:hypothetical protein